MYESGIHAHISCECLRYNIPECIYIIIQHTNYKVMLASRDIKAPEVCHVVMPGVYIYDTKIRTGHAQLQ